MKIVTWMLHGLGISSPEGGELVVCLPPGESGENAFGWFGDMEPNGGMYVTSMPG